MKRGGQRAERAARREAFHAARMQAAATPKAATHVAIDQVRAVIAKLAAHQQDEAWKTVTRHLMQARQEISARTSSAASERSN